MEAKPERAEERDVRVAAPVPMSSVRRGAYSQVEPTVRRERVREMERISLS